MRDALIALGMGGPESVETIRPFLYNLFSDREIINFHIGGYPQKLLAKFIASKRSKKIAPEYLKMGYGGASPQNIHTQGLLSKLPAIYKNKTGRTLDTFGAMCYFHPYINEAVENISKNNYEKLIILPLFPQYSFTTTGACFSKLNKFANVFSPKMENIFTIPYWYNDEAYCQCILNRIDAAAIKMGKKTEECFILFSAHSLPERMIGLGDPYVSQIKDHAKILATKAGVQNWTIGYQSKVGPVKWVGPSTIDTLQKLKDSKTDNIIVVPLAFVSDHIETLIELDEQLIPIIKKSGLNIERSASLNSDDDFVRAIGGIISRGDK